MQIDDDGDDVQTRGMLRTFVSINVLPLPPLLLPLVLLPPLLIVSWISFV